MNLLYIGVAIVWVYFMSVFRRGKLHFFRYLLGSVGLFLLMMIFVQPYITGILTRLVTSVTGLLGRVFGFFEAYREYSTLFIENPTTMESISLYIDYECSGVIEMMAFLSLLTFFEVYEIWQRILIGVIGCLAIFASNIIRIFVICSIIYVWGNDAYYIAHTVIGRLVFYILAVLLYYFVFTKSQIVKQKVGGFRYAKHAKNAVK